MFERRSLRVPGLLFVVLLVACAPTQGGIATSAPVSSTAQPQRGGSLTIAVGSEPLTFDPPNMKSTFDVVLTNLIFDGLVGFDKELKIIPRLATKWQQTGPTTWRFDLRQNVKFSDGSAFSARDVKASLERAAPQAKAVIGFIRGVDVVNSNTVDIQTTTSFGPFLPHMASPVAAITSADYLAKTSPADMLLKPLGTGPFTLTEYLPKQRTVISRNETYWGDAPYLDKVTFVLITDESARYAALQSGQADVIGDPPPQQVANIDKSANLQVIKNPAIRDVRLGFQIQEKTMSNVKLRSAIAHAIDTKSLVDFVAEGMARQADNGWLAPEVVKTNPALTLPFDLAKAKQEIADAGYPNGLTLELVTPQGAYLRDKEIAEAIQQQLKQIGITVNIKVLDRGALFAYLAAHSGQMYILGWGNSTGDPAVTFRQNFYSTDVFNYAGFKSPELDKLLEQAEQTTDQAKRTQFYNDAQKILFDQVVLKPIYWKYNLFAAKKTVRDFLATPIELIDITRTWIQR